MTPADICNLALSYLGDTATVSSIDPPEGSAQAQHCARFYPIAVQLMLEMHQWNFVTKRVQLALVTDGYSSKWQFAYALPSDAGDVISVFPYEAYRSYLVGYARFWDYDSWPLEFELDARNDFEIETANGQPVLLSNAEDAVARYTSTNVQSGMFSALFTDALAWKLASMLAGPLLKGDAGAAESKRCLQIHAATAAQAMGQDANQQRQAPRPIPIWMRER